LIDTTYARRAPLSGTGVYLSSLVEALAGLDEVEVLTATNPYRRPPAGGGIGSARNLAADAWWTEAGLPAQARRLGVDVVHHPLPALSHALRIPQVVTVHDLAFDRLPEAFDRRYRAFARVSHRAAARRASVVIAVSETTAADLRELWGVPRERIVVALHGPGQPVAAADGSGPPGIAGHFLYVGDGEPRKDLGTLLAAYARYRAGAGHTPLPLVVAGSADVTAPGVVVEGVVGAARLSELYSGAAALVHTSRYEGFGMTVLEAMASGVPVVAARSPGVVEVGGDAVRYFSPGDAVELAETLAAVAEAAPTRSEWQAAGLARAGRFSWSQSAQKHLAAYSLSVGA
jgi:glycosyltransferase involved in cell wall biosynthesis